MKKFTTPNKIEKDAILSLIDNSINVSIKSDPDKYLNTELKVEGKDKLTEELHTFVNNHLDKVETKIVENLKNTSGNFVDTKYIANRIKKLNDIKITN